MRKKYKRKVFLAMEYDAEAIQQFLEEMAEQGYMYVKNQGVFYCFEECEPRKIKFQVDYFDKANIMDTNPEEKTLEYIEFCQECGWKHISSNGKMQIFYSEEEDITPLHTDEKIKLKYIAKNTLLVYGIQWFFLPLMFLFSGIFPYFFRFFVTEKMGAESYAMTVADCFAIFMPLFAINYMLYSIISILRFMRFYLKNRQRVNNGETIEFYSCHSARKFGKFSMCYVWGILLLLLLSLCSRWEMMLTAVISFLVIIAAVMAAVRFSQSKYANRIVNIVSAVVVGVGSAGLLMGILVFGIIYVTSEGSETIVKEDGVVYIYSYEEIPVTLEMLGVNSTEYDFLYEERYKDEYKSPWAEYISYGNWYVAEDGEEDRGEYEEDDKKKELPYFSVDIFQSPISKMTKEYTKKWLETPEYNVKLLSEETAKNWGAEQAYAMTPKNMTERDAQLLLIIKEEKVIVIAGNFEASEQAKEALQTLY